MRTTIDETGTLGSLVSAGRLAGRRGVVACLVLPLLLVAEACSRSENSASAPSQTGPSAPAVTTAPSRSASPSSTRPGSTSTASPPNSATSGPDSVPTDAPTSPPTPKTGSGESTVTGGEKTTPPTPKRTRKIKYPTGGPRGPVIPPGDEAYQWLAEGKCQRILDRTGTWEQEKVEEVDLLLYRGAASACLFDWQTAIADLTALRQRHRDVPDSEPEPVKCGDDDDTTCQRCRQIVFQWLSDVVEAHEEDPQATLVFTRSSEPSLCPDPEPEPEPEPDPETTTTAKQPD